MSNNLNLADSVNFAWRSGKTPTFIYEGTTYEFSPQGLVDFFTEVGVIPENVVTGSIEVGDLTVSNTLSLTDLPTSDPVTAGEVWVDTAADFVLKVSQGA